MMTPSQLLTFKAAILADVNLAAARAAGDHGAMVAYYNANGASQIWRPNITNAELNTAIVWTEFSSLSVGLQNTYMAVIYAPVIDATSANVRGAFTTIFGPATVSRANLTTLAQRLGTRFELLFTTAQVSAVYGTPVSVNDVVLALGS